MTASLHMLTSREPFALYRLIEIANFPPIDLADDRADRRDNRRDHGYDRDRNAVADDCHSDHRLLMAGESANDRDQCAGDREPPD